MVSERTSGPTVYEALARERKAYAIAQYLYSVFLQTVQESGEVAWLAIAEKSGQHVPSEETRALVLEILRARQPKGRE